MNNERGQESTEETPKAGTPWGFFLVLAAIVVVAIVYSVTIFAIDQKDRTPEILFGAMAASFTVIGTLVGTYFGIKAGLDGQDKVRRTLARATNRRPSPGESERNRDRQVVSRPGAGGERNGDRKRSGQQEGEEHGERTWHGGSV